MFLLIITPMYGFCTHTYYRDRKAEASLYGDWCNLSLSRKSSFLFDRASNFDRVYEALHGNQPPILKPYESFFGHWTINAIMSWRRFTRLTFCCYTLHTNFSCHALSFNTYRFSGSTWPWSPSYVPWDILLVRPGMHLFLLRNADVDIATWFAFRLTPALDTYSRRLPAISAKASSGYVLLCAAYCTINTGIFLAGIPLPCFETFQGDKFGYRKSLSLFIIKQLHSLPVLSSRVLKICDAGSPATWFSWQINDLEERHISAHLKLMEVWSC